MPSSDPAERRPYDASGRQAAARRKRAAVLRACRELLLSEGYQATTVRAVAQRAGVSPETVYKTYGNKPGLMKALWDTTLAGDDEPVPMSERPALRQVWAEPDPDAKLRGYAAFVCGVHTRTASLFVLLGEAGPEVARLLAVTEEERLTGVTAFVEHLAGLGMLRPGVDRAGEADACWVLTGPHVYARLTGDRQWDGEAYQRWLHRMLAASLLP
ncbi:helix-turn-helix domain-containing protein [Streptomyces sp. NPDC047046]|uniref:TetR/AcrR family transcriptional regulator n=1 Tax=Streptomyces sp. NPDC047046 TaxID=3155378 RepID=UPI0033E30DD2